MSKEASLLPYQLVSHWLVQRYGYYHEEKWETKEDNRLPASKLPMQTGNTPHYFAIPTVIIGTIKHKIAIAWALEKYCIFVMGCPKVVTDHQPPTRIFGDRDLSKVQNLHLLQEKCLRYSFSSQYCPGKWHQGADAISHNPMATVEALISLCPTCPSSKQHRYCNGISHHPNNDEYW